MKRLSAMVIIVLFSSLLLVSCGKTSQQKAMESDLNKRVMQLHDSGMAKMRQAQALDAQLDSAKALHVSLAAKFPKNAAGHSSDDIAQAKGKIESAQAAMHAWMSTHKPYDPEAKHDEVMAQLNADVQELTNVSTQFDTAITDATGTVENHRKFAAELLAKPVKKGRK
jgi:hypothetical protein